MHNAPSVLSIALCLSQGRHMGQAKDPRYENAKDFSRRLLLFLTAAMGLGGPILFGLVTAPQDGSERQAEKAAGNAREFEVASIKPSKSDAATMTYTAYGFNAEGVTLRFLIRQAYGVDDDEILGGPNWIKSKTYDVEAKAGGADVVELTKLSLDERRAMLQPLLTDRFKLAIHRETRELPIYALVVAKKGPKLKEAKPGDTYPNGLKGPDGLPHAGIMSWGRGRVAAQGVSMASLVRPLSRVLGRTVLDKTGLTGKYDFTLEWEPDDSAPISRSAAGSQSGNDNDTPPDTEGSSLFTALQEQLGLKIQSQKGPITVIAIDHVEEPSPN